MSENSFDHGQSRTSQGPTGDEERVVKQFEWTLTRDVRLGKDVRTYICKICSKGFRKLSNMKSHVRTHLRIRPFSCSNCAKQFSTSGNRDRHVKNASCWPIKSRPQIRKMMMEREADKGKRVQKGSKRLHDKRI